MAIFPTAYPAETRAAKPEPIRDPALALLAAIGGVPAIRLQTLAVPCLSRADSPWPPAARVAMGTTEAVALDDDLALIDRELALLFAARELALAWAERTAEDGGGSSQAPAQFLRAWGDSTARVIHLLTARRALGADSGQDALLEAVYAELEARLGDVSTPVQQHAQEAHR